VIEEARLRFQEPLGLHCVMVLGAMALCDVAVWIVILLSMPLALATAYLDDER